MTEPLATDGRGSDATFGRLHHSEGTQPGSLGGGILAWAPAAVLCLFIIFAVRAGLSTSAAMRASMVVVSTQIVPGAVMWRLVRPIQGWWFEDVVMGFALGACLAVAVQIVAGTLGIAWLTWSVGPLLVLVLLSSSRMRKRLMDTRVEPLPTAWGPAVGAITLPLLISTQAFYRRVPLEWEGFRAIYPDIPFHLSLASQIAQRGPGEIPYVVGEPLQYHWFSHAWVAQVSLAGDVPLDAVLVRFMPPFIAVIAVSAIAITAVRLSGRAWVGPLAAFVAVAAGELDLYQGARSSPLVNPLSPSLGFSIVVALGLLALLVSRWRYQTRRGAALFVVVLAITAAGAKGSALPVLAAGVGLAFFIAWAFRWPERRTMTLDLVLVYGSLLGAYVLLFGGSPGGGLRVDPGSSLRSVGLGRLLLENADTGLFIASLAVGFRLLSVLARSAGLLGAFAVERWRQDPTIPLLSGTALAGAAAVVLFAHPGKSQWYFLRNAVPAMAIGSAIGLFALWETIGPRRNRVFGIGVILGLGLLVAQAYGLKGPPEGTYATWFVIGDMVIALAVLIAGAGLAGLIDSRSGGSVLRGGAAALSVGLVLVASIPPLLGQLRNPLPPYNQQVAPNARLAFSSDQVQAARWLRDNSSRTDIVATNRHCAAPDWVNCDSRRFFVAAYTERRVLVEGWAYTRSWSQSKEIELNRVYKPFWNPEVLELNDSFIESPDRREAERLHDLGVRWIFIDKTAPYSTELTSFSRIRYQTEWALVLELTADTLTE